MNTNEDLVVGRDRLWDLLDPKDFRRPVPVIDDRSHRLIPSMSRLSRDSGRDDVSRRPRPRSRMPG
jgi:hypothetical protein